MQALGFDVTTLAGAGTADTIVPGLAMDAPHPPTHSQVSRCLDGADLVLVENLCSLPLNPAASAVLADVLRGRRALLRHHDLPWQRERFLDAPAPPTDPEWLHVTINDLSRRQLSERNIQAVTIYNCFDTTTQLGDRAGSRAAMGARNGERILLQPTRAIARKDVPAAIALARAIGATYWLLGPPEEDYGEELDAILSQAACRVIAGGDFAMADAYAACDAVAFPSSWEGFGNPSVESAVHRRPLAIGPYPVAQELAAFGFRWFPSNDPDPLRRWLDNPDPALLDHNWSVANRHFDLSHLPHRLEAAMNWAGWRWK